MTEVYITEGDPRDADSIRVFEAVEDGTDREISPNDLAKLEPAQLSALTAQYFAQQSARRGAEGGLCGRMAADYNRRRNEGV